MLVGMLLLANSNVELQSLGKTLYWIDWSERRKAKKVLHVDPTRVITLFHVK